MHAWCLVYDFAAESNCFLKEQLRTDSPALCLYDVSLSLNHNGSVLSQESAKLISSECEFPTQQSARIWACNLTNI